MKFEVDTKALSLNNCYPTGRNGRRYLTPEGKAYKELIAWKASEAMAQYELEMTEGGVSVNITFEFKDKRRRDIDNFIKLVLDAMSGVVYKDDSQVTDLIIHKRTNKEDNILIAII